MISRQVITGKNATISKPTVVKNITSDVYYMEPGYNLYSVIALTSNVLYLNEFTSPISIYLAAGTIGTLEIFPFEDGGETIDGDLSITLTNEFDGVTLYPLGGGRFSASYWKTEDSKSF